MADEYVGQFVGFDALARIQLVRRDTDDNNIILGIRFSTRPRGSIEDGSQHVVLTGIDIDIHGVFRAHADILRKPYQSLGGRIV